MTRSLPTITELRKMLSYDPDTGVLTWRHRETNSPGWNTRFAGTQALNTRHSDGYRMGKINCVRMYAHRAAWALHHGSWPSEQIDHINGNRSDNRMPNLQEATASENAKNRRVQPRVSGVPCVWWVEGSQKWRVLKRAGGQRHELGSFHCIGQAIQALAQLRDS